MHTCTYAILNPQSAQVQQPAHATTCTKVVCRHATFFALPPAHLFMLGILKDFWNLWLRPASQPQPEELQRMTIPVQVQDQMDDNLKDLKLTSEYTKGIKNIRCVLSFR